MASSQEQPKQLTKEDLYNAGPSTSGIQFPKKVNETPTKNGETTKILEKRNMSSMKWVSPSMTAHIRSVFSQRMKNRNIEPKDILIAKLKAKININLKSEKLFGLLMNNRNGYSMDNRNGYSTGNRNGYLMGNQSENRVQFSRPSRKTLEQIGKRKMNNATDQPIKKRPNIII